jgi:prephenate dehydrogenase
MAACSHLPHVIAFVLMNSLRQTFSFELIRKIMGNSFRGMTRISGSDAKMWADIFLHNKLPVMVVIKNFQKKLDDFEKSLKKGSISVLQSEIQKANRAYQKVWA